MSSTDITEGDNKRIQGFYQNNNEQEPTSSGIRTHCQTTETKTSEKLILSSNSSRITEKAVNNKTDYLLSESSKSLNDLPYIKNKDHASLDKIYTSINIVIGPDKFKSNSLSSIENILGGKNEQLKGEQMTCPTVHDRPKTRQNIIIVRNDFARQNSPAYQYNPQTPIFLPQNMPGQNMAYQPPNMGYQMGMPQDRRQSLPFRNEDIDIDMDMGDLFNTREVRNKFIRKVYLILAVQLLFTFAFITFCIYDVFQRLKIMFRSFRKNTREFVKRHWLVMVQAIIILFVLMIILVCYKDTRRTYPFNFILLSVMTLCTAYVMAGVSCYYETKIVMISMGAASVICTLISIFAWFSWFDITRWGTILFIAFIIVISFGMFSMIIGLTTGWNISYLIFSGLLTVVFCVYLMYDTQKILGGRRIEVSPEEYILGAMTLYINILIIFHLLVFLITHCK